MTGKSRTSTHPRVQTKSSEARVDWSHDALRCHRTKAGSTSASQQRLRASSTSYIDNFYNFDARTRPETPQMSQNVKDSIVEMRALSTIVPAPGGLNRRRS